MGMESMLSGRMQNKEITNLEITNPRSLSDKVMWWEKVSRGGSIARGRRKLLVIMADCDDGFSVIYLIKKLSRLCTLKVCILLYVSYTSVRQLNFVFQEMCLQRRLERQSNKRSVKLKNYVYILFWFFKNRFIRYNLHKVKFTDLKCVNHQWLDFVLNFVFKIVETWA